MSQPPPRGTKRQRQSSQAPSSESDSVRHGLLSLNSMQYKLAPDVSIATARQYIRHFAQTDAYLPGQRMIIVLNSGAHWISGPNSALIFTIKNLSSAATGSAITFGVGSAINLIRRIVISSRSGEEIERVDDVNQLCATLMHYTKTYDWLASTGTLMGCNPGEEATNENNSVPKGQARRFVIPLSAISGLFASDKLLPSMLCSGMRIEIELAPAVEAVIQPDAAGYEVKDVQIALDSTVITDSTTRLLNELSATGGLEVTYQSFHTTEASLGSTSVNIAVRKSVSRALQFIFKTVGTAATAGDDYMASKDWGYRSVHSRIGSVYLPNQPIFGDNAATTVREVMFHSFRAFQKVATSTNPPNVKVTDFLTGGKAVFACDLERSTQVKQSGLPLNNSRVCEVLATFETSPSNTKGYVFLQYLRLARCFISNVEVEE